MTREHVTDDGANCWCEPDVYDGLSPNEKSIIVHQVEDPVMVMIAATPCRMFHEPPYDFAYCEVHDTTFALGDVCRYQKMNAAKQEENDGQVP